ncbi:copper chaperone PCu(A)C [Sphingosinicellaceae bacterium]|nr:copper chaperone PCu(A)C [Sphingosinicellaceae bacterium]
MTKGWERAVGWGACAVSIALLVAALVASRVEAATGLRVGSVRVEEAVVALAAVPGRPAAGYFTLSGGPATLTSVASPLASRVEMHSSSMAGGVMSMEKLAAVLVHAGTRATFAPGGNHLMIFGLASTVKAGSTVPLQLHFADGQTVRVEARAVAPGMAMEMHEGH